MSMLDLKKAALTAGVAAALLLPAARADDPPNASSEVIVLRRCVLEYDQSTVFMAPYASVLQDRLVKLGDRVKAGQVLGRLFDKVVRAEMDLNAAVADNDLVIRMSKAELALAENKLRKTEALAKRQYVTEEERLGDRFAVEKARLAVEDAEQRRRMAQINRRRAEAEVLSREFVSPHDGIVVGAFKNQGESVTINEPLFKVVNTERLKVWGGLNVADLWKVQVGDRVLLHPEVAGTELPIEREAFQGRVAFIDSQVDQDTQVCRLLAEVDNPQGLLKAGLQGTLEIMPANRDRSAKKTAEGPVGVRVVTDAGGDAAAKVRPNPREVRTPSGR
jgi:RND family efflux transporter MFP subunit